MSKRLNLNDFRRDENIKKFQFNDTTSIATNNHSFSKNETFTSSDSNSQKHKKYFYDTGLNNNEMSDNETDAEHDEDKDESQEEEEEEKEDVFLCLLYKNEKLGGSSYVISIYKNNLAKNFELI